MEYGDIDFIYELNKHTQIQRVLLRSWVGHDLLWPKRQLDFPCCPAHKITQKCFAWENNVALNTYWKSKMIPWYQHRTPLIIIFIRHM